MTHPEDSSPPPEAPSQQPETSAANDKGLVMVIDDSSTVRSAMSVYLERNGYSVVSAVDGFTAMHELSRLRPRIIFADIVMPRVDGYEFCVLVNSNEDLKDIPVVLVSSKNQLFDRARARVCGSRAFLSKPFTEQQLLTVIEEIAPAKAVDKDDGG